MLPTGTDTQHVNEMMAVVVNDFRIFDGHVFLSDKTLTWPPIHVCTLVCPEINGSDGHKHGLCFGHCC